LSLGINVFTGIFINARLPIAQRQHGF